MSSISFSIPYYKGLAPVSGSSNHELLVKLKNLRRHRHGIGIERDCSDSRQCSAFQSRQMRQRDRLIGHDVSLEAGSSSQRGRTAHLPVNVRRLGSAGQDYLRAGKRGEGCPNLENKYCVWISLRVQRQWTGGDL